MSIIDDGGPAFTQQVVRDGDGRFCEVAAYGMQSGMSLRDYFAAKAMQAAATNPVGADGFDFWQRAEWAYAQADAMLKARVAKESP